MRFFENFISLCFCKHLRCHSSLKASSAQSALRNSRLCTTCATEGSAKSTNLNHVHKLSLFLCNCDHGPTSSSTVIAGKWFPYDSYDRCDASLTKSRGSRVAGPQSRSRVQSRGRGFKVAVAGSKSRSRVQSRGRGK